MTKKPFAVGQRVRVYGSVKDKYEKVHYLRGKISVVKSLFYEDEIEVSAMVDGWTYSVHPKQCRRLKPKAPRFECWVNVYPESCIFIHSAHATEDLANDGAHTGRERCVHMREVIEKKK